VSQEEFQ